MSSNYPFLSDETGKGTNGLASRYDGDDLSIIRSMTAFSAIAWYNAFELLVLIFCVFKKYEGAYFWSLLICSISIIVYQFGAWTKQIALSNGHIPLWLSVACLTFGWLVMIPSESLVLWSRLHLVTQHQRLLRLISWLIISTTIFLCIPTITLSWGASMQPEQEHFVRGYAIIEKLELVVFSAQEIFISGVYIWEVRKLYGVVCEKASRNIMCEIIVINVVIILFDVAMIVVQFNDFYEIQTTMKGMIYSVKLKMEFAVLSKLVNVVAERRTSGGLITPPNSMVDSRQDRVDLSRSTGSKQASTRSGGLKIQAVPVESEMVERVQTVLGGSEKGLEPLGDVTCKPTLTAARRPCLQTRPPSLDLSYPGRLV